MMMRHRRWALGAGSAVAMLLAAGLVTGCQPAGGTVSVGERLVFTAAAGQANQVTVTASGDELLVTDAGDEVNPGSGCIAVDAHTARCSVTNGLIVALQLGDGNDQATNNTSHTAQILGGPGSDTLNGGSSVDALIGDAGADTLDGNDGDDLLFEALNTTVVDALDRDVYRGGEGFDQVSYQRGTAEIKVDLDGVADDGRPRERDNAGADIEKIVGTDGDDRLTGDADDNQLLGEGGNDTLLGGAGFDSLSGGPGTDICDVGPDSGSTLNCEAAS